jgi:hypothetical protein
MPVSIPARAASTSPRTIAREPKIVAADATVSRQRAAAEEPGFPTTDRIEIDRSRQAGSTRALAGAAWDQFDT